jgi:aminoglycoside phosphotransferase (APT) family kinase protein
MRGLLGAVAGASAHTGLVEVEPLAGGVSSDIYRVDCDGLTFCVKRALPKLKVAADWRAPTERNRHEAAWLAFARGVAPDGVPEVLAEDEAAGAFAMTWLAPERFPVWKHELRDGRLDRRDAAAVGDLLGRLHAASADRAALTERFATDALFHAIRLDPYLVATARAHPDLAGRLQRLVARTAATRRVLVHGDYSPKNLLVGPSGPVVLDAECAWFGDPAFDLAFVLNHLLLKGAWRPQWRDGYGALFVELIDAYRPHVNWESWRAIEERTASLLPALLLARIDGKSPVEYLTDDAPRARARDFARARIERTPATLRSIVDDWCAQPAA